MNSRTFKIQKIFVGIILVIVLSTNSSVFAITGGVQNVAPVTPNVSAMPVKVSAPITASGTQKVASGSGSSTNQIIPAKTIVTQSTQNGIQKTAPLPSVITNQLIPVKSVITQSGGPVGKQVPIPTTQAAKIILPPTTQAGKSSDHSSGKK